MMKTGLLIKTNDEVSLIEFNQLSDLYPIVGCNMIEVAYPKAWPGYVLLIDEEGKYKEKNNINIVGTLAYGRMPYDVIVGDMVVCRKGLSDLEGLTSSDIKLLKEYIGEQKK